MHIKDLFAKIHNSSYAREARETKNSNAIAIIRHMYSAIRRVILDQDVSHQLEDLHTHMQPAMYNKIAAICGFMPTRSPSETVVGAHAHAHDLVALVDQMQTTMQLLIDQARRVNEALDVQVKRQRTAR